MTLDEIIEAMKTNPEDLRLQIYELEIHRDTLKRLYDARDGMSTDEAKGYLRSVLFAHPDDL